MWCWDPEAVADGAAQPISGAEPTSSSVTGAPQTTQPVSSSVSRIASSTSIERRHSGQTKVWVDRPVIAVGTPPTLIKRAADSREFEM